MHFFYISVQWGRSLNTAALQSLRQQAKNPPIGSIGVTATALKILLSFSRFARESHGWLRKGNDNVLRCPCVGDPRCARMTEEKATLPRPHSLLSFRGSASDNPRLGREPGEADRGRKGGAREREKLSPQGGSGAPRTLRRRNPTVGSTGVMTMHCPAPEWGIPRGTGAPL